MLLLAWPPVRVVCPNNEVVVFQTWIWTALKLGSITLIITTHSSHLLPHLFQLFLDILFSLPYLTTMALPSYNHQRYFTL